MLVQQSDEQCLPDGDGQRDTSRTCVSDNVFILSSL